MPALSCQEPQVHSCIPSPHPQFTSYHVIVQNTHWAAAFHAVSIGLQPFMQSVPSTIAYCWSYFKRTLYFTLSKPTLSARCCAMALCSSVFSVWGALPVLSVLTVTCSCAEPVQGTQANHDVRQPLLCSASFSMKLTQSKSCYALKRLALQQYMTLQYSSQESLLPLSLYSGLAQVCSFCAGGLGFFS